VDVLAQLPALVRLQVVARLPVQARLPALAVEVMRLQVLPRLLVAQLPVLARLPPLPNKRLLLPLPAAPLQAPLFTKKLALQQKIALTIWAG